MMVPLWHFLYANVLDVMRCQPFQEHFLLLGEFDDRALLPIQGRDEFKDPIGEPLRAMLSVDPVVVGLQRWHVWRIGRCHEVDELGPQTSGDGQGWGGGMIDGHKLVRHNFLHSTRSTALTPTHSLSRGSGTASASIALMLVAAL